MNRSSDTCSESYFAFDSHIGSGIGTGYHPPNSQHKRLPVRLKMLLQQGQSLFRMNASFLLVCVGLFRPAGISPQDRIFSLHIKTTGTSKGYIFLKKNCRDEKESLGKKAKAVENKSVPFVTDNCSSPHTSRLLHFPFSLNK